MDGIVYPASAASHKTIFLSVQKGIGDAQQRVKFQNNAFLLHLVNPEFCKLVLRLECSLFLSTLQSCVFGNRFPKNQRSIANALKKKKIHRFLIAIGLVCRCQFAPSPSLWQLILLLKPFFLINFRLLMTLRKVPFPR